MIIYFNDESPNLCFGYDRSPNQRETVTVSLIRKLDLLQTKIPV